MEKYRQLMRENTMRLRSLESQFHLIRHDQHALIDSCIYEMLAVESIINELIVQARIRQQIIAFEKEQKEQKEREEAERYDKIVEMMNQEADDDVD